MRIFLTSLITAFLFSPVASFGSDSPAGRERQVAFDSYFETEYTNAEMVRGLSHESRARFIEEEARPALAFISGPLVNRWLGQPVRDVNLTLDFDHATMVNGRVRVPYHYEGVWALSPLLRVGEKISVPVPLGYMLVFSPKWKLCTSAEVESQADLTFSTYWDPAREGCRQTEGVEYRTVEVTVAN